MSSYSYHLICNQSAVHRSFAVADNLGEVSAKAQVGYIPYRNADHNLFASITFIQLSTLCRFNQCALTILVLYSRLFLTSCPRMIKGFVNHCFLDFNFSFSSMSCKYS